MLKIISNKVVCFFVEGDTEIEFYKAVVKSASLRMGRPIGCTIEYVNLKGCGNYKNEALRRFKNLQLKHKKCELYVVLCFDSDVFFISKRPPFNKEKIQESLIENGAQSVYCIEAKHSIEDWFLCDFNGVLSYLRLPRSTKLPRGNGQDALRELFKKANKIYVKGKGAKDFIAKLDVLKIINIHCMDIRDLCVAIGWECKKICPSKSDKN